MQKRIADWADPVICHEPDGAGAWQDFLSRCPNAHIEQTIPWGRLKQVYGWKPLWFWIARGSRIAGGAMILTRRLGPLAKIGYLERGPVWDPSEAGSIDLVTNALSSVAASAHLTYLAVVPPYCGEEAVPRLRSMDFRRKPKTLPPTGVGQATLLMDLTKGLDALLADMSMTKRQNIRRAIRKNVKVRLGDGKDADIVRELMWTACQRRGLWPSPSQKDYFDNFWHLLGPSGLAKFFIAEIDGEPVSAAVAQVFSGTMQLYRVGWSGTHDDCNPNDLLHWEMMKWAKENGCHTFDFLHIRPDHARAILRGERVKDSYSGVTEFKTSFGGQIQLLPELYYRSFDPFVRLAMKMGGERIVEFDVCRNMFGNMLSQL